MNEISRENKEEIIAGQLWKDISRYGGGITYIVATLPPNKRINPPSESLILVSLEDGGYYPLEAFYNDREDFEPVPPGTVIKINVG